ncbi:YqaA family protein [Alteromonas flava]|uniref:YqaA family protein n=1 Tax=Alteromonas flava TaxID=2048003 RepID=UPI000C29429A|nr:YqaA family protein [Alteromonas flava]
MTELLAQLGLPGLFLSALLAATILPFGSEAIFISLLLTKTPYLTVIIIASIGNTLGSAINYTIGRWLSDRAAKRWLRLDDAAIANAQRRFDRYGLIALCFAWVPIIGDPITLLAGMLRVRFGVFLLLVAIGKTARYGILAYVTYSAM